MPIFDTVASPAPQKNDDCPGPSLHDLPRAIEHGNLLIAEMTLRAEIPRPSLVDLLDLTALIAQKDPHRRTRVAARWLERYLAVRNDTTIDEIVFAATALQALGGPHHGHALVAFETWPKAPLAGGGAAT